MQDVDPTAFAAKKNFPKYHLMATHFTAGTFFFKFSSNTGDCSSGTRATNQHINLAWKNKVE